MSGWIYILQCADESYYTGSTKNLAFRLSQHQNGEGANYTKKRLPVKLVFSQEYERIDDAFYVEKQVQGWSRKKKQALINGDLERLPELAKCQNESHCSNNPTSPFDSAQGPVTNVPTLDTHVVNQTGVRRSSLSGVRRSSLSGVRRSSLSGVRRSSLSGVEGHGKTRTSSNPEESK